MEPISFIIALSLAYGGGYLHRYITEPEYTCQTVDYEVPAHLKRSVEVSMCKRGLDSTGIQRECYVNESPVYELLPRDRSKVEDYIIELQLNLFKCQELTEKVSSEPLVTE